MNEMPVKTATEIGGCGYSVDVVEPQACRLQAAHAPPG